MSSFKVKFMSNEELRHLEVKSENNESIKEIIKDEDCTILSEKDMRDVFEQLLSHKKSGRKEDRTIPITEFKDILKRQCKVDIKMEELRTIFNNKEAISFQDYWELMNVGNPLELKKDPVLGAFTPLANDGYIPKDKLKKFLELDDRFRDLSDKDFDYLFEMIADADRDGKVNLEDFKSLINLNKVQNGKFISNNF